MSDDELLSKLHQQNVRNAQDRRDWGDLLTEVEGVLAQSRRVTSFDDYYKWWREHTREGQEIKGKLFEVQSGKCFKCQGELLIPGKDGALVDHSEIHHLAPRSLLQRYAEANPNIKLATLRDFVTSQRYLRLVHPLCNKYIGVQVADLPDLQFLRDFAAEHK